MRPLIITVDEKAAIKAAIERARARPLRYADLMRLAIPDKAMVTLADRGPEHDRPPSQHVAIPFGFHLAISFEEQPAGLTLHLSVSVEAIDKAPSPHAMAMICGECLEAVGHPEQAPYPDRHWLEEFLVDGKPGGIAVNVVYVLAPAQGGRA